MPPACPSLTLRELTGAGDPAPDGGTYSGVYDDVAGVVLSVNGQPQPTGAGCPAGEAFCTSSQFLVP